MEKYEVELEMKEQSWSPPRWIQPFNPTRFQQGSQVLFEGLVSGAPSPDITWTWRGKPLQTYSGRAGQGKIVSFDPNNGRVTLMLSDVGPGDEGVYTCTASNPYGESSCTINLSAETKMTPSRPRPTLPKGSCRTNLKACHIDSDDYADYARLKGL
ncbi:contactin-5 [Eurytemora carolleeae]|uniref:contactin-5 n=1 Tax=Eurytemora carolleeae TaxID=1294199 RepID=UPI000C78EA15|nr:contactin-5 [Eurytemora carolleeae]|eukprot:XP_023347021.1 contactin-5-like [Eurytemora affinis]